MPESYRITFLVTIVGTVWLLVLAALSGWMCPQNFLTAGLLLLSFVFVLMGTLRPRR